MKRLLGSIALAAALGMAGGALAQDEEFWDDDWATDEYGYYDEDFEWDTADEGFDDWYANADEDWEDTYDDTGDEGLFDV